MPTPQALERQDEQGRQYLFIQWDDGVATRCSVATLQENCPCANCGEKRKAAEEKEAELFPMLKPEEASPTTIVSMRPAGNYAYAIAFSAGCNQGIYTFKHLRAIGEAQ